MRYDNCPFLLYTREKTLPPLGIERITVLTFDHDPSSGFVTINELCSVFKGEVFPFLVQGGRTAFRSRSTRVSSEPRTIRAAQGWGSFLRLHPSGPVHLKVLPSSSPSNNSFHPGLDLRSGDIISNSTSISQKHNQSMDPGSHRATKAPTLQGRPPYDTIARRAQSDEPLDGPAVTSDTSSQQLHSKEARPADNQTTAVAVTPSRGRTSTAGRRNANELDIELDSRSLGDQQPAVVSSVERLNSSSRYGPSTAHLPDASGSQGNVGRSVDPELSLGKQETARAPPPTSAGTHSTQDQPKPVIGAPANNSSQVSAVGLLSRRPSVDGDWKSSFISPGSHYEPSSISAPRNSPEALAKRETGPVPIVMSPSINPAGTQPTSSTSPSTHSLHGEGGGPSVRKTDATGLVQRSAPLPLTKETSPSPIDKPKGGVTGETEALPEPLLVIRDVLRSPDEYKGIVPPNDKLVVPIGSVSRELEGLLPSSGHTKTTAMAPPHNYPIALRSVHPSSSVSPPILQTGGMSKQVAAINSKFRPEIALHNSTLSPMAAETSRSSSRSSRMEIQTKPGDETTKTQPHHLQISQSQANPAQQPSGAFTQLFPPAHAPCGSPERPSVAGRQKPPFAGRPRPPSPPKHPFSGRPKPRLAGSPSPGPPCRQGCCSCFLSFFKCCSSLFKCCF